MTIKSILVHVDRDARFDARMAVATGIADRFGAHLVGLFSYGPPMLIGYGDAYAAEEIYRQHKEHVERAAAELRPKFEDLAKRAGVSYEWRSESETTYMTFAVQARYSDLVVVGQNDPDEEVTERAYDLAEEVVMSGGTPVLTVPYAGRFGAVGKTVMVAWNGTRESARAVRDAMPFLEKADRVVVYSVNPTDADHIAGADIATHLARHGVKAEARHTVARDIDVGDAILSAIADNGIDMLVMGAYGHTRFREFVLGGATRHIFRHMTVPALFSH